MIPAGPIFTIGFMATGKSKIGRLLAARLGREFVDTDALVEARAGRTIAAIFAAEGEAHFRRLECECVAAAAARPGAVIALGGGAVTQERNWELIRAAGGVVVCLEAEVETIAERVDRRDDRPLLAGLGPEEKRARIAAMLEARAPYYSRADIRLHSSDEQEPERTVEELIQLLELWDAKS